MPRSTSGAAPLSGRRLSIATARRIALRAQGFTDTSAGGTIDRRHVRRVLARIAALQIDSVNVLVRSHYLPLFSRLGSYRRDLLDEVAYGRRRELFEYWGHEASLLPLSLYPLMRWRMARAERLDGIWRGLALWMQEKRAFVETIFAEVERRGPLGAGDLEKRGRASSWWGWSETKAALEYLFWAGRLTTAYRRNFERVYDLTERALPRTVLELPAPEEADAQRELVRIAMRALGVATARDLRDYFRLPAADAKLRIPELVTAGDLVPTQVEGWKTQAYTARDAMLPRSTARPALLSPFDSLVWERDRAQRLFAFHYRIEIYTPAHKRIHGYYVLPFLLGDELVARVDLKADRIAGRLQVKGLHLEGHAKRAEVAEALEPELERMASWLDLDAVTGLAGLARRGSAGAVRNSGRRAG